MKTLLKILAGIILMSTLVLTCADTALAKGYPKSKPAEPSTPVPHHTIIETISATSITVREPKGARTLAISQFTSFTFKGTPVRFDALKPGMRVAIGTGTDPNVAERVDADDPPKDGSK